VSCGGSQSCRWHCTSWAVDRRSIGSARSPPTPAQEWWISVINTEGVPAIVGNVGESGRAASRGSSGGRSAVECAGTDPAQAARGGESGTPDEERVLGNSAGLLRPGVSVSSKYEFMIRRDPPDDLRRLDATEEYRGCTSSWASTGSKLGSELVPSIMIEKAMGACPPAPAQRGDDDPGRGGRRARRPCRAGIHCRRPRDPDLWKSGAEQLLLPDFNDDNAGDLEGDGNGLQGASPGGVRLSKQRLSRARVSSRKSAGPGRADHAIASMRPQACAVSASTGRASRARSAVR